MKTTTIGTTMAAISAPWERGWCGWKPPVETGRGAGVKMELGEMANLLPRGVCSWQEPRVAWMTG